MAFSYAYKVDPNGNPPSFVIVEDVAVSGMQAANRESFAGTEGANLVDASIIAQIREALLRSKKGPIISNGIAWVDAQIADTIQSQLDGQQEGLCHKFISVSYPANSRSRRDSHVELSAIDEVKAVLAQRMPLALAERVAQAVVREVIVGRPRRSARQKVVYLASDALSLAA